MRHAYTAQSLCRVFVTEQHSGQTKTREAYVGIDVAFAKRKRLPVCIATWHEGRLVPLPLRRRRDVLPPRGAGNRAALDEEPVLRFARDTLAYIQAIAHTEGLHIQCVAIDAPRAPKREGTTRRLAEVAMDRRGLSCFATPSRSEFETIREKGRVHLRTGGAVSRLPHANQLWMRVGFALFEILSTAYECLEVYPNATVAALGAHARHKSKAEGLQAQIAAVARATGWPLGHRADEPSLRDISFGSRHDKFDAYLAAWVAALPEAQREPCGTPPDDVIWIPRVDRLDGLPE